jgi:type III pantothenate kinase
MKLQSIDNGNSNPHVGLFDGDELISVTPLKEFLFDPDLPSIASSVGPRSNLRGLSFIDLSKYRKEDSFLDMPVNYETTLGEDRLHQAYYIFKQNTDTLSLLIDAGTFTTVDFIDSLGFKGGFIFPGIKTQLDSYGKGAQLPVLDNIDNLNLHNSLPDSTNGAISDALKFSQISWLEKILKDYNIDQIYISGGYSNLFNEAIKDIFKGKLFHEKNLIHYALQKIYLEIK